MSVASQHRDADTLVAVDVFSRSRINLWTSTRATVAAAAASVAWRFKRSVFVWAYYFSLGIKKPQIM